MALVELPPAGSPAPLLLLAVGAALLFLTMWMRARRRPPEPHRPGSFEPAAVETRRELERLLAEIQDLSREHIARLDTKIRLLTQLLDEADRRQRELRGAIDALPGAAAPAAAPAPSRPAPPPLHEKVYALQDAGKDVLEISGATGLEKGEIELILGLRRMS